MLSCSASQILTLNEVKGKDPLRKELYMPRGSFAPLRIRELELLFLTMFAAVPLYGTQVISFAPLIALPLTMNWRNEP